MSKKYKTAGSIERLDPAINSLIPEGAEIEILASGFDWSEGPLWLESQSALIFSDVPANKIYRWSEKDGLSVYLEPSGYFGERRDKKEPGSNGLTLDNEGNLILCQHGLRQLGKMRSGLENPEETYETLADSWKGNKFNSPNDVVIHKNGGIYFTDPPYGLDPWDEKELEFQGVYRLLDGELKLEIEDLYRPNGVALNPDHSILYVAQSDPEMARYYEYKLSESGEVQEGKILLDVSHLISDERRGLPDGLKVHSSGNVFATGPGGVLVISPIGKILGTILTGQATANCAFDADENYLYMTADMHLMRIKLK
ncbi:SMP-30/gluconolactonase/LRE family protein [Algoriphagus sp. C2-7]|uniref:SMP-30/gluconolactonase/LRE family protein n=2 Tax=Algoriphagus sediminis TaxID=3057113 RepID=A0ABT7Y8Z1_9BACT|nr:SMP-30/gluconolactonase/LRE family protein [Algoriphagus sediminis]